MAPFSCSEMADPCQQFGMHCAKLAWMRDAMLVIASESGRLLQLQPEVWRTPPSRRWAGGRVWHIWSTSVFQDSSWRAIRRGCADVVTDPPQAG